ncbi:hypothetical protein [Leisingera aquimarina]|uniref:hypothetical protein n=1 Tax=Leisingera aquimarina TaxID=476529 RepID=UPI0003F72D32|nr:hypothetical protein [Leisingera aquimarina]
MRTPFLSPLAETETRARPKPKPLRAPLFIQDAVTPWADSTMLLALWRQQEAEDRDG